MLVVKVWFPPALVSIMLPLLGLLLLLLPSSDGLIMTLDVGLELEVDVVAPEDDGDDDTDEVVVAVEDV